MATIAQIRTAIATALGALDGMRAAEEWGDQINVSGAGTVAVVEKGPTTYDSAMDGQGDAVTFTVTVLASKSSDRSGKAKLDALCDPGRESTTSVRNAVNGSLGSLVAFATVTADTEYREYEVPPGTEARYLGCEFTVRVET